MKRFLAMLFVLLIVTSAACAEELIACYWGDSRDADAAFLAAHPGVRLGQSRMEVYPFTASEMAGKMLTREFDYDVFFVETACHLPQDVIDKGYALDLSGSEIIREAVARLHPTIRSWVEQDGHIYGFPYSVEFKPTPMICNPEAWEALGYTEDDIPQSFPEFLDFLDAWVARQRQDFRSDYWVFNSMDVTAYTASWYTNKLASMLIDNYVLQKQFAEERLTFDEPELLMLMKRVQETGAAIYSIEQVKEESLGRVMTALFTREGFGLHGITTQEQERWYVPLRLNREQPAVVTGTLDIAMVYAGTDKPELAIDYIESIIQNNTFDGVKWDDAMLYVDGQPIINEKQAEDIRRWSNLIALGEHRLAGDQSPITEYLDLTDATEQRIADYAHTAQYLWERSEEQAQKDIDDWQWYLDEANRKEYLFSPESLAAWQRFVQTMYFPGPSPLSPDTEGGWNVTLLIRQFAAGTISAEQLLRDVARIEWMMEMENQ